MLMPDNFEIREDGTLVLIVNEVEYEFKEMDDFIYSDKKKIILKHHAVINLAANAILCLKQVWKKPSRIFGIRTE